MTVVRMLPAGIRISVEAIEQNARKGAMLPHVVRDAEVFERMGGVTALHEFARALVNPSTERLLGDWTAPCGIRNVRLHFGRCEVGCDCPSDINTDPSRWPGPDADDVAIFMAAHLKAMNRPVRFVVVQQQRGGVHIFVQTRVSAGEWVSLDPHSNLPPREEPNVPGVFSIVEIDPAKQFVWELIASETRGCSWSEK